MGPAHLAHPGRATLTHGGGEWRTPDWRLLLALLLVASSAYGWLHLDRGWIPHDEGALGQSAERVLRGELPHRDFTEIYTGGLSYLNAAAFQLLGTTLWTLRVTLFALFVAWVPAVFYIASRFVPPGAAAGVTLLAVVWTLPAYPEPMPSWYNLFLATMGVAALFRHMEDGRQRWLVAAGMLGGLSILVKIVGLYYVAGVLLYLVFRTQERSTPREHDSRVGGGRAYALFVMAALALFVIALVLLVRRQPYPTEFAHFVLPGTLLALLLARRAWRATACSSGASFASLALSIGPFLAGLAMPLMAFLVPYLQAGAVGTLLDGVFVLPTRRFVLASMRAMPLSWMLVLVPVALLVAIALRTKGRFRRTEAMLLAVALSVLLVSTGRHPVSYRVVWLAAFSTVPVLVASGVAVLSRQRGADISDPLLRERTMLLLSVTALCAIVQFPYSVPIYFCYVAPLVALSALALTRYLPRRTTYVPAALAAFLLAFAITRINRSEMTTFGNAFITYGPVAPLPPPHGGLRVRAGDAELYGRIIPLLRSHARGGYTWASPDAPEMYFLSGLRNPTRSLFEFFDEARDSEARVLRSLESHGVTAIVLNAQPTFSAPLTREMFGVLATRFPNARNAGLYQVRWRDSLP